jgi:chemotaxis protein histidine kinase CheA
MPTTATSSFAVGDDRHPARSSGSSTLPASPSARSKRDDFIVIARAAHRLKGASGMIGAAMLRQIAEAVERAAKAEDLPTVRRLREIFNQEVHRVAEQAGVADD